MFPCKMAAKVLLFLLQLIWHQTKIYTLMDMRHALVLSYNFCCSVSF